MKCKFLVLSYSTHGKVVMCSANENRLALLFNNLSKSYTIDEFLEFKNAVDHVKVEEYFNNFPYEKQVFMKTTDKHLFFCFSRTEIYELRTLLANSYLRFRIELDLRNNLN